MSPHIPNRTLFCIKSHQCPWNLLIHSPCSSLKKGGSEALKTPRAGIGNAARGNGHRRSRGLPSPHAAFSHPPGEAFSAPAPPLKREGSQGAFFPYQKGESTILKRILPPLLPSLSLKGRGRAKRVWGERMASLLHQHFLAIYDVDALLHLAQAHTSQIVDSLRLWFLGR